MPILTDYTDRDDIVHEVEGVTFACPDYVNRSFLMTVAAGGPTVFPTGIAAANTAYIGSAVTVADDGFVQPIIVAVTPGNGLYYDFGLRIDGMDFIRRVFYASNQAWIVLWGELYPVKAGSTVQIFLRFNGAGTVTYQQTNTTGLAFFPLA